MRFPSPTSLLNGRVLTLFLSPVSLSLSLSLSLTHARVLCLALAASLCATLSPSLSPELLLFLSLSFSLALCVALSLSLSRFLVPRSSTSIPLLNTKIRSRSLMTFQSLSMSLLPRKDRNRWRNAPASQLHLLRRLSSWGTPRSIGVCVCGYVGVCMCVRACVRACVLFAPCSPSELMGDATINICTFILYVYVHVCMCMCVYVCACVCQLRLRRRLKL